MRFDARLSPSTRLLLPRAVVAEKEAREAPSTRVVEREDAGARLETTGTGCGGGGGGALSRSFSSDALNLE